MATMLWQLLGEGNDTFTPCDLLKEMDSSNALIEESLDLMEQASLENKPTKIKEEKKDFEDQPLSRSIHLQPHHTHRELALLPVKDEPDLLYRAEDRRDLLYRPDDLRQDVRDLLCRQDDRDPREEDEEVDSAFSITPPSLASFSPQHRSRCNTWPRVIQETKQEVKTHDEEHQQQSSSSSSSSSSSTHSFLPHTPFPPSIYPMTASLVSPPSQLPLVSEEGYSDQEEDQDYEAEASQGKYKASSRRNPWGNYSYADLITQAIQSSSNQRLTLSQIYEWMTSNVPYFKDRGDVTSSAGWKNSIRHNLSLHQKFVKVQNEGAGKSSWWTISREGKPGPKTPRRRAASMETNRFRREREKALEKAKLLNTRLERANSASMLFSGGHTPSLTSHTPATPSLTRRSGSGSLPHTDTPTYPPSPTPFIHRGMEYRRRADSNTSSDSSFSGAAGGGDNNNNNSNNSSSSSCVQGELVGNSPGGIMPPLHRSLSESASTSYGYQAQQQLQGPQPQQQQHLQEQNPQDQFQMQEQHPQQLQQQEHHQMQEQHPQQHQPQEHHQMQPHPPQFQDQNQEHDQQQLQDRHNQLLNMNELPVDLEELDDLRLVNDPIEFQMGGEDLLPRGEQVDHLAQPPSTLGDFMGGNGAPPFLPNIHAHSSPAQESPAQGSPAHSFPPPPPYGPAPSVAGQFFDSPHQQQQHQQQQHQHYSPVHQRPRQYQQQDPHHHHRPRSYSMEAGYGFYGQRMQQNRAHRSTRSSGGVSNAQLQQQLQQHHQLVQQQQQHQQLQQQMQQQEQQLSFHNRLTILQPRDAYSSPLPPPLSPIHPTPGTSNGQGILNSSFFNGGHCGELLNSSVNGNGAGILNSSINGNGHFSGNCSSISNGNNNGLMNNSSLTSNGHPVEHFNSSGTSNNGDGVGILSNLDGSNDVDAEILNSLGLGNGVIQNSSGNGIHNSSGGGGIGVPVIHNTSGSSNGTGVGNLNTSRYSNGSGVGNLNTSRSSNGTGAGILNTSGHSTGVGIVQNTSGAGSGGGHNSSTSDSHAGGGGGGGGRLNTSNNSVIQPVPGPSNRGSFGGGGGGGGGGSEDGGEDGRRGGDGNACGGGGGGGGAARGGCDGSCRALAGGFHSRAARLPGQGEPTQPRGLQEYRLEELVQQLVPDRETARNLTITRYQIIVQKLEKEEEKRREAEEELMAESQRVGSRGPCPGGRICQLRTAIQNIDMNIRLLRETRDMAEAQLRRDIDANQAGEGNGQQVAGGPPTGGGGGGSCANQQGDNAEGSCRTAIQLEVVHNLRSMEVNHDLDNRAQIEMVCRQLDAACEKLRRRRLRSQQEGTLDQQQQEQLQQQQLQLQQETYEEFSRCFLNGDDYENGRAEAEAQRGVGEEAGNGSQNRSHTCTEPGPSGVQPVPGPSGVQPVPGPSGVQPVPGPSGMQPVPGPSRSNSLYGPPLFAAQHPMSDRQSSEFNQPGEREEKTEEEEEEEEEEPMEVEEEELRSQPARRK